MNKSIGMRFGIFSIVFFLVITGLGLAAFFPAMKDVVQAGAGQELARLVQTKRLQFQSSVDTEIAVTLKMAGSAIIKRYLQNPGDEVVAPLALEEIAAYRKAFASGTVFWVSDADKRFYSDDAYSYTVDPSNPDDYWYNMTLHETKSFNFNINYNDNLKKTMLWLNAPVFDNTGKPVGMVGTGVDLSAFVDSIFGGEKFDSDTALYIFNGEGEITGAADKNLVLNKTLIDDQLGGAGAALRAEAAKLGDSEEVSIFTRGSEVMALGGMPRFGWYVAAGTPVTAGMYLEQGMTKLFFAMLAAALLIFIVVNLVIAGIMRPLRMMMKTLHAISTDWDLTRRFDVKSGDEMGRLAEFFNLVIEKMNGLLSMVQQQSGSLSDSVFNLSSSAKEISATANQQSASVSEIVSTMENNKNLSERMADNTVEVADLARQTEELSRKGAEIRDANQDMMEDIRRQNVKIITEIKNLVDMLSRIDEAIGIIDGIADQTKLIAFNASLEASSSGEAGVRFGVVASEIRRFADNVVDSTTEIKQRIEEVQSASQNLITEAFNGSKKIDQGYERMVEQKEVFENIVENSRNVAERSQQISDLSRQQENASGQIFATLKEISLGVKQFVTATVSTSKIADGLNVMSDELKETVNAYKRRDE